MRYTTNLLASTYGSCSYGSVTYQATTGSTCASASGGSSAAASGGSLLTDTGFDALLIASVACVIIFVALIIRFWKRPKRQQPAKVSGPASSTQQDVAVGRVDEPEQDKTGDQQGQ